MDIKLVKIWFLCGNSEFYKSKHIIPHLEAIRYIEKLTYRVYESFDITKSLSVKNVVRHITKP